MLTLRQLKECDDLEGLNRVIDEMRYLRDQIRKLRATRQGTTDTRERKKNPKPQVDQRKTWFGENASQGCCCTWKEIAWVIGKAWWRAKAQYLLWMEKDPEFPGKIVKNRESKWHPVIKESELIEYVNAHRKEIRGGWVKSRKRKRFTLYAKRNWWVVGQ